MQGPLYYDIKIRRKVPYYQKYLPGVLAFCWRCQPELLYPGTGPACQRPAASGLRPGPGDQRLSVTALWRSGEVWICRSGFGPRPLTETHRRTLTYTTYTRAHSVLATMATRNCTLPWLLVLYYIYAIGNNEMSLSAARSFMYWSVICASLKNKATKYLHTCIYNIYCGNPYLWVMHGFTCICIPGTCTKHQTILKTSTACQCYPFTNIGGFHMFQPSTCLCIQLLETHKKQAIRHTVSCTV